MLLAAFAVALADPPAVDTPRAGPGKSRADAAVVIGVEDYAELPDAPGALADAKAMAEFLSVTRGVPKVELLTNPTREQIRTGISKAADAVRGRGLLWIYFSGQGAVSELNRRVILGSDATPAGAEGVSIEEMVTVASDSRARQALLIVDASFGGSGRGGESLGVRVRDVPAATPPDDDHISVWLATTGPETAPEYPATGHGMFTYFALGALRGWADGYLGGSGNAEVSYEEAQAWVTKSLRLVGGKAWAPSAEPRPEVLRWALARGMGELGPDKDEFAAMAQTEKQRRVSDAQSTLLSDASSAWMEVAINATTPSPENQAALRTFIERYEVATVTVDGVDVAVVVPQVTEARARLDGFSRSAKKKNGRKKKPPRPKPIPVAAQSVGLCDDLIRLEPAAITGVLSPAEITCLEGKLGAEPKQTKRDKLSRVLLANADGKGDSTEWMKLAARHLEEIDRSDPDLCFRYALLLNRTGDVDDGGEVLHWVGYALENKQKWQGPAYTSRVYNLLRLQAETVNRMWQEAEGDFLDDRSEEQSAKTDELRGQAKNTAREWLDWAKTTAQPTDRAFNLCQSAAGSMSFCEQTASTP